jgi:hypothetical protein
MAKTGRPPYETSDVVRFGVDQRRLSPPASLGDAERRAFVDLVTNCPAGQFHPSDLPLLCRWAELVVMAETAAKAMANLGMLKPDGKPSGHFAIHREATRALNALALRLRLGPQSRAQKAPRRTVSPASYYEKMQLLEGASDGSEPT